MVNSRNYARMKRDELIRLLRNRDEEALMGKAIDDKDSKEPIKEVEMPESLLKDKELLEKLRDLEASIKEVEEDFPELEIPAPSSKEGTRVENCTFEVYAFDQEIGGPIVFEIAQGLNRLAKVVSSIDVSGIKIVQDDTD